MDGAQAAATHMPSAAAATEVDSSATATEVHSAATAAAPKGKCITCGDQGTEGHTGRKNP